MKRLVWLALGLAGGWAGIAPGAEVAVRVENPPPTGAVVALL